MNVNIQPYKRGLPRASHVVGNGRVSSLLDDFLRLAEPRELVNVPRAFPVNVSEGTDGYELEAYVAGVEKDQIDIAVEDGDLTITLNQPTDEEKVYAVHEWALSSGSRTLALPKDADPESVKATMDNGVLRIAIQKVAEKQPKKVAIG